MFIATLISMYLSQSAGNSAKMHMLQPKSIKHFTAGQ